MSESAFTSEEIEEIVARLPTYDRADLTRSLVVITEKEFNADEARYMRVHCINASLSTSMRMLCGRWVLETAQDIPVRAVLLFRAVLYVERRKTAYTLRSLRESASHGKYSADKFNPVISGVLKEVQDTLRRILAGERLDLSDVSEISTNHIH